MSVYRSFSILNKSFVRVMAKCHYKNGFWTNKVKTQQQQKGKAIINILV